VPGSFLAENFSVQPKTKVSSKVILNISEVCLYCKFNTLVPIKVSYNKS